MFIVALLLHLDLAPPKTHPAHLSSTQDLLARFSLLSAYDKYVRPFAAPGDTGPDQNGPAPSFPSATGVLDKGKGKEIVGTPGSVGVADGADGDDDEATGKGEKKKSNTYKHLIKGVPGTFYCSCPVPFLTHTRLRYRRQTLNEER